MSCGNGGSIGGEDVRAVIVDNDSKAVSIEGWTVQSKAAVASYK